jgi:hypothetical protein
MKDPLKTGFTDRLAAQAEAKRAMLSKFKPKPMVQAEVLKSREELRQRELEAVRAARAAAKEEARLAAEAQRLAELDAKRGERKQRKATTKADQRAAREAKAAARRVTMR